MDFFIFLCGRYSLLGCWITPNAENHRYGRGIPVNTAKRKLIKIKNMESTILKELQEIKSLTLLAAKPVLTTDEAAAYTGISKSFIYKLCMRCEIPHWKSSGGKITYYSKNELDAWMLHRRVKTNDELDAEAVNHVVTTKIRKK